jgi:hypothetical protein
MPRHIVCLTLDFDTRLPRARVCGFGSNARPRGRGVSTMEEAALQAQKRLFS